MRDATTYRAGEFFPTDVLCLEDQYGEKYPVKVRSDLDAHVDGETLQLTVHPGGHVGIEVSTEGMSGLILRPSPNAKLRIVFENGSLDMKVGGRADHA